MYVTVVALKWYRSGPLQYETWTVPSRVTNESHPSVPRLVRCFTETRNLPNPFTRWMRRTRATATAPEPEADETCPWPPVPADGVVVTGVVVAGVVVDGVVVTGVVVTGVVEPPPPPPPDEPPPPPDVRKLGSRKSIAA